MGPVLLDTDVFSFLFKRDTRAAIYSSPPRRRPALPELSDGSGVALLVPGAPLGPVAASSPR
jgi:hypothetical protein